MSLMFSKHAVDALNAASSCARQFGHDHIGAEHHQTIVNGAHIVGAADVNLALLNDVAGVYFVL